jgi:hypothetical protein
MRGDATTSQSGREEREGRNQGAQQEAKVQQESEALVDRRHQRDSPGWRLFFNMKGKKGGLGRMPTARNIFVILGQSLGGRVLIFS